MVRQVKAYQLRKRAEIIELIEDITEKVWEEARENVPVASGEGKRSIKKDFAAIASDLIGEVRAEKFYLRFVEDGTVNQEARPFLKPAYRKYLPEFITRLRKILAST